MTQTTKPSKERLRDITVKRWKERQPPMSPEQFKQEMGWALIKDSGKR